MNSFDVTKSKIRFALLREEEKKDIYKYFLSQEHEMFVIGEGFILVAQCFFYLYENININFHICVRESKLKEGSPLLLDDINMIASLSYDIESPSLKNQILSKVRLDFFDFLYGQKAYNALKMNYKIAGVDVAKGESQNVETKLHDFHVTKPEPGVTIFESANISGPKFDHTEVTESKKEESVINSDDEVMLDAVDKAIENASKDEPEPILTVQDKSEQTAENKFGYNESGDDIPFEPQGESPGDDNYDPTPVVGEGETVEYDLDELMSDSMPEQISPHEENIEEPETKVEENVEEPKQEESILEPKKEETKTNMFSSSLDDDLDFSDVMGSSEDEEDSDPSNF